MIQIRNSIFETNSSSSHSIICTTENKCIETVEDNFIVKDGVIKFWSEYNLEFGRSPFNILSNWYDRLCYVIASCYDTHKDEIYNACIKHIPGFCKFEFPTSCWDNNEEEYHGYIDHQSLDLLQHTLKTHNITIEDFIFNDRYIVIIDGDEYQVFDRLLESKIFNLVNIEYIENAIEDYEIIEE